MRSRAIMAVLALLALAACSSWPPKTPGAKRGEELRRLEERVRELQRQSRMAEVEIERLRRQVAELEGTPEVPATPAHRDAGPPPAAGESNEVATEGSSIDRRIESEELPPATSVGPVGAPVSEPARPSVDVTASAQALYDTGYTLYHQGRLVDAESAFRQFLQAHPASDLADNAQFWIGAARLQRDDVNGALAAFRETISRFPRGNKVPDAMLKSGECLAKLGDPEEARRVYREVVSRFPTTAAAALAAERLEALR